LASPVGSNPLPSWARGPVSVPYRSGTPTYKLQIKTRSRTCTHAVPCALQHQVQPPSQGGLWGYQVSSASNPTSLIGSAPAPSHVSWVQTLPPCRGGLRCTACHTASDLASLHGRAPERHVSHGSGSYLPTGRAPVPPPHDM
jgi:hypothetical protein